MKVEIALLLLLLLAGLGCVQGETGAGTTETVAADKAREFNKIESRIAEKAIDGDTILLQNGERLRLIGLDAPEKGEDCWLEARDRLHELVAGKSLVLERDASERDKYGRLVRFVYANGQFVNLAMVEEGLAKAFAFEPDISKAAEFEKAEARASRGKGCIWKKPVE